MQHNLSWSIDTLESCHLIKDTKLHLDNKVSRKTRYDYVEWPQNLFIDIHPVAFWAQMLPVQSKVNQSQIFSFFLSAVLSQFPQFLFALIVNHSLPIPHIVILAAEVTSNTLCSRKRVTSVETQDTRFRIKALTAVKVWHIREINSPTARQKIKDDLTESVPIRNTLFSSHEKLLNGQINLIWMTSRIKVHISRLFSKSSRSFIFTLGWLCEEKRNSASPFRKYSKHSSNKNL